MQALVELGGGLGSLGQPFGAGRATCASCWRSAWLAWPWSGLAVAAAVSLAFLARCWSSRHASDLESPARSGGGTAVAMADQASLGGDLQPVRPGPCARLPRVRRTRVAWPYLHLLVRPCLGQTAADFEAAAEAVRAGVGASRLRVEPHGVRDVLLTFTIGDELRAPFDARPAEAADSLDYVRMGRREDGEPWRLAVGPHTLVAGCSGSGKGSLFWSFAFGLAPAVREGRVQLHGVDLKGGMEILMGEGLFSSCATNAAEAVQVLEMLVTWMRQRAQEYAGRLRSHSPASTPRAAARGDDRRAGGADGVLPGAGPAAPRGDGDQPALLPGACAGVHGLRLSPGPAQGGHPVSGPVHADGGSSAQGPVRDLDGAG